ncbi:hypothetical protein [Algoriphagus yeomjeoni]|uniref:Uncharacterized protein n=1 Tax=Algoriphagus yeomjeoni TaxID=291403 RepID=A0A327PKK4_9BACT|nr:hypothetical protein [Algoriphagus yeomjeoni]RAI92097.1 hypothetical protein LV83_01325 [Algoriphagus yeomjeoni]
MDTQERTIDLYEVAEIKLSYSAKVKASQRPKVDSSRQLQKNLSRASADA